MTLGDLLSDLGAHRLIGDRTTPVREIRDDSREVSAGDVFVAVRGLTVDGHQFARRAVERGAAAIVVEEEQPGLDVAQVIVTSGAKALGWLAARAAGRPAAAMTMIGITGTNGKTTTTYLVESILEAAGHRPGVIGTVSYRYAGKTVPAPFTTPAPLALHATFRAMRAAGCTHVVMEVSSAALALERLEGVAFHVGAFTNLTQDHLDLHKTMDAYREAKRRLFAEHLTRDGAAVSVVDDAEGEGRGMLAATADGRRRIAVSGRGGSAGFAGRGAEGPLTEDGVNVGVLHATAGLDGVRADVVTPRGKLEVRSPALFGDYNVANVVTAIGIAEALGIPHDAIARGVEGLVGVPGRVERVPNARGLDVFVDYAHTPDALERVIGALRPLTRGRLIVVFGCGGDRDRTKRPKMGQIVAERADLAVVTSDNPRTEEPRSIIDMILDGVKAARPARHLVEVDRRAAISAAVREAEPGKDVVLIAGKGHEDYQILGTQKIHFDDREEAARAAEAIA